MIKHCNHCQKLTNNDDGYCSNYCRQFKPNNTNFLYNCLIILEEHYKPKEICDKIGMNIETYKEVLND